MAPKRPYASVLQGMTGKELLIPYFRNALISGSWPDSYDIKVDSGPYYGHGDGRFHPSSHPLMGARELYYRFHPDHADKILRESRDPSSELSMSCGSAVHAVVQTQFQMAGLIKGPEWCEVEYTIEEHNVRGRADFIVHHPDNNIYPVEFKSQNSRSFNFQDKIQDKWDAQLSLALHGLGYPTGVLLLMEMGYPFRMKEFVVNRNDELLSKIFEKFDYVMECIAADTPPPHCCPLDSVQMKACPARFECWLANKVVDHDFF